MTARIAVISTLLSLFSPLGAAQDPNGGVLVCPVPRTQSGGQRWALVIGINDYNSVPALRYGRSGAEALADALINKCGFPKSNVALMTDAPEVRSNAEFRHLCPTRVNLRARIEQIAQNAEIRDLLLISFSGHGVDIGGRGYLMPVDGDSQDSASLVPMSWLKETLESSRASEKMLLLDACHAGAESGDEIYSPAETLLSPLGRAAFATLASCDSQQFSHEDTDVGLTVFANAVVEGLEGRADSEFEGNRDGIVTASELFAFVSSKVKLWSSEAGTTQSPVLRGEFEGPVELARFKTIEQLRAQLAELQESLKTMQEMELSNEVEQLKSEIAELEAQLGVAASTAVDEVETSEDLEQAYAAYDAAKRQHAEIEAILAETMKTSQPASSVVAKVEERLDRARADLLAAAKVLRPFVDSQIRSKQAVYEELTRRSPPSAPKARNLQQQIDALKQRQAELKFLLREPGEVATNSIGMNLVWIPPGEFMMGSPPSEQDRDNDEGPVHRVEISRGFWMGQCEVTQSQWRAVMDSNPSRFKGANLPVENVRWRDAVKFCRGLSEKEGRTYRLPTEAEWEYACRAGNSGRFCFGDRESSLGDYARYVGNSGNRTHPVGQRQANAFGLYDMHGNVWEWCQDWYEEDYYSNSPDVDPLGPSGGSYRVLRGGSWYSFARSCRSAYRSRRLPVFRSSNFGFRVVVPDS